MTDRARLISKLEGLLRGSNLTEEQENDPALVQEARTKAYILLKLCRDNGVKISFAVPSDKSKKKQGFYDPPHDPWQGTPFSGVGIDDIFRQAVKDAQNGRREDAERARRVKETEETFKRAREEGERQQRERDAQKQADLERKHRENIARKEAEEAAWREEQMRAVQNMRWEPIDRPRTRDDFWPGAFDFAAQGKPPIQVNINHGAKEVEGSTRGKVEMDTPMIRAAAFPGICRACGTAFDKGSQIWWRRGIGSTHALCDPSILGGVPPTKPAA